MNRPERNETGERHTSRAIGVAALVALAACSPPRPREPVPVEPRHATQAAAPVAAASPGPARPGSVAPPKMQANAPALADDTDDVLFGDVWRRPELAPRDRSLVTVSVLITTGRTGQLKGHLGRALDNGVRPQEISAVVGHLAFYAGWPSAVSALDVVDEVFTVRGVDRSSLGRPAIAARARGPSDGSTRALDPRLAAAPKLAELTADVLEELWRRPDLTRRDRSLVTIAAVAAMGQHGELATHLRRGLDHGLTPVELGEALTHLAFYAGWPRSTSAIAVADGVLRERTSGAGTVAGPVLPVVSPGATPVRGPATNFIGTATVTSPFKGTGGSSISGATVSFEPGARSNWHEHPGGQLLIVIAGRGWVQAEGEEVRLVRPGDVVWTPPGVRHWHGATRGHAMTHVAVSEAVAGQTVQWLQPVTPAEYRGPE